MTTKIQWADEVWNPVTDGHFNGRIRLHEDALDLPLRWRKPRRRRWPNLRSSVGAEPDVGRVADGIPRRVDRLRGLGNAVVPQVAEWIGHRILGTRANGRR